MTGVQQLSLLNTPARTMALATRAYRATGVQSSPAIRARRTAVASRAFKLPAISWPLGGPSKAEKREARKAEVWLAVHMLELQVKKSVP
eukprot:364496-Chlamydomonas_euryale.AAC.26